MRHRRGPRPAGGVVGTFTEGLAPATLLAGVQRAWPDVVGPVIAAQATPTAARDGTVTVSCAAAVWAQELDLMAGELVDRLNARLGASVVRAIRVQSAPSRAWARRER